MQELKTNRMTSQLTDDGSRSSLQDVSVKRSVDVGPGHHLVVLQLKMKLPATKKGKNLRRRNDVGKHKLEDRGWESS